MTKELVPGKLYFINDKSILNLIWLKYCTHYPFSIKELTLPITLLFVKNKSYLGCCGDIEVSPKYCICNQEFLVYDKSFLLKKIFVKKTYEEIKYCSPKTGKEQGLDFKEVHTIECLADILDIKP